MAISPVTMPQLGESVTEGTIGKWLKQPGDAVEKYESLAEVITDKVNAEIPSPVAGVIRELKVEEGATVPVGTEILSIDEGGSAGDQPSPQPTAAAPTAEATPAAAPQQTAAPSAPTATAAPPSGSAADNGRSQPQPEMPADMSASVAAAMPQPSEQITAEPGRPATAA